MPVTAAYRPDPRFAALGPDFADAVEPADFPAPRIRVRHKEASAEIGLDALTAAEWLDVFAHFQPLPENQPEPLATRYHGHQFRTYNPQIGDGRGFLFAQVRDPGGRLMDLGTKGSGQTPYSRSGDGRMTLQGGVREALISEFLHAHGVPGCRILSLIETGETLHRDDEPSPTRGAVMVRYQHSHVRIGTFQRHAAHERADLIAKLVDFCLDAYGAREGSAGAPAVRLLDQAVAANARLAARWMAAGFVHGVLNSDNMTVTGESFDYGPSRFLHAYAPGFTAAYFDQGGLYAYARQSEATLWNLTRLAECLTLVAPPESLTPALEAFQDRYQAALGVAVAARLGVTAADGAGALDLVRALFAFLEASGAPFHGVLHDWFGGAARAAQARRSPRARLYRGAGFEAFYAALADRPPAWDGAGTAPHFADDAPAALPIQDVRAAWDAIEDADDWRPFQAIQTRSAALAAATRP